MLVLSLTFLLGRFLIIGSILLGVVGLFKSSISFEKPIDFSLLDQKYVAIHPFLLGFPVWWNTDF